MAKLIIIRMKFLVRIYNKYCDPISLPPNYCHSSLVWNANATPVVTVKISFRRNSVPPSGIFPRNLKYHLLKYVLVAASLVALNIVSVTLGSIYNRCPIYLYARRCRSHSFHYSSLFLLISHWLAQVANTVGEVVARIALEK